MRRLTNCAVSFETKAFEQGKLYYNVKSYQACLTTLDNLMVDFPETKNHREIRFLKAKANYEWAVNSIFEKTKRAIFKYS
jgi:outer membrane protein assembly factor BamD